MCPFTATFRYEWLPLPFSYNQIWLCFKTNLKFRVLKIYDSLIFDYGMEALEEWIAGYIIHKGLQKHNFSGMGTGIRSGSEFKCGSCLISAMPQRYYTPKSVLIPKPHNLNGLDKLVAFLIIEDFLGSASNIGPYLASMPRKFSNPLYLDPHVADEDVAPELKDLLQKQFSDLKRCCLILKEYFGLPELSNFQHAFTKHRFLWSYFAVATRSLYLTADLPALVPFVDFFNHSPEAKVSHSSNILVIKK